MDANDICGYGHVFTGSFNGGSTIAAGGATLSLFAPEIFGGSSNHSIMQLWMQAGSLLATQNCTTGNCIQSLEVGWSVDPLRTGRALPTLFVYSTSNGYGNGCYDNVGGACVPNYLSENGVIAPGASLPRSVVRGAQTELSVAVEATVISGTSGWGMYAEVGENIYSLFGFYSGSAFNSAQGAPGLLSINCSGGTCTRLATSFRVGGEVYDPNRVADSNSAWSDQLGFEGIEGSSIGCLAMGSGGKPTSGYGFAGYANNYFGCTGGTGSSLSGCSNSFTSPASTRTGAYAYSQSPAPSSSWPGTNYAYVGDTLGACTPSACW